MKPWKNFFVACILLGLLTSCSVKQDLIAPSPSNRDPIIPPPANQELIVLLLDPDGKVGTIQVTTEGGSQILDKPGYATEVEGVNKRPVTPKPINEKEITDVFGPALLAQPDPAGRFILFILHFDHDTTKLTHESKGLLPEIVRTIKSRKSNEVYVVGHTDLVGTEAYNIELSSRRAKHVRNLFVSSGIKPSTLFVSFYGKSRPLVPTKDEVPEPLNRRVEVVVR
jgi:outer membrane protein OmpA-like peptidoglycan-associated protein